MVCGLYPLYQFVIALREVEGVFKGVFFEFSFEKKPAAVYLKIALIKKFPVVRAARLSYLFKP